MGLKDIKLLISDVDGVLTDGTVTIGPDGEEWKHFNVHDWTGIKYLMRAGLQVALVSGRTSEAVRRRALDVDVTEVRQGVKFKAPVIRELIATFGVEREQVAYIGDDLPDIPAAREAGFSVAVANAHEELKSRVDLVTKTAGGAGAVRELAEAILKARGKWAEIMKRYIEAGLKAD